jgi:hypothetical protein
MANTDPQVVNWANNRSRPICTHIARLYYELVAYTADYAAGGIAAQITAAGATEIIADGAGGDGRNEITGTNLVNLLACINQIKTALDTTNVAGVGSPPTTTINIIQTDGSPR